MVLVVNVHTYLDAGKFIPEATRHSQVRNVNLMRSVNRHHPSEHKNYPSLAHTKKLRLVAEPALKRVYGIDRVTGNLHDARPNKPVSPALNQPG